jgi:uncharacterized protein (TIGR02611 family)
MERMKKTWFKTPTVIRKPLVLCLGLVIVVTGIILLPLPGPGWAIIFVGFAVLATEFTAAEKVHLLLVRILKYAIAYGLELLKQPWKRP